jgi:hypothetical protein
MQKYHGLHAFFTALLKGFASFWRTSANGAAFPRGKNQLFGAICKEFGPAEYVRALRTPAGANFLSLGGTNTKAPASNVVSTSVLIRESRIPKLPYVRRLPETFG